MTFRPYQPRFVDAMLGALVEFDRVLGVAPTGSGKCLGRGTPVLMFDGTTRPVETIKVGDRLMGPDSTDRRVRSVCRGREPLYRVVPLKGAPYVVNASHILSLRITGLGLKHITDANGQRYRTGEIAELTVRDYLRSSATFHHCAKGWRVGVEFAPADPLPALLPPYLLGLWLGDGHSNGPSISKPDPEIEEYVGRFIHTHGLTLRKYEGKTCPTLNITAMPRWAGPAEGGNPVQRLLREYGLLGNKHIPHPYKTASRADRLQLLAGLIDSDGAVAHGGCDWITSRERLAQDFAYVARSLGFAAYMHPCRKSCQNGFTGDYYRVSVSGDLSVVPTRIARKRFAPRRQIKDVLVTGIRVEPMGEGEYFGFELDGDGRFLLGDFTVTHNTVMAGEITRRCLPFGPVLFLADAQELVKQAADKLGVWAGVIPQVEMAEEHAQPGDRLVVATTQSMARRLEKWPADYFSLVIVDEAHRNTLGTQAQKVLGHFAAAQVAGITATPFRSDKQQLSTFYQTIPCEISLVELIKEGYLARIVIQSVPVRVDLSGVRTRSGDYREEDLGVAIEPHLAECAHILAEFARGRRTVVFLPLIETSKRFVEACREYGLRAVHVDGEDRTELETFRRGEADIICNASLLTTGWDEPSLDCVMVLRPTKSLVLYSQMIGRGTRIHPGKENLLVLDPMFLSDKMDLIRPGRLLAQTPAEADSIQEALGERDESDLLEAAARALETRRRRLAEKLAEQAQRNMRVVDAIEFAVGLGEETLLDYEPTMGWEREPVTPKQAAALERMGFSLARVTCKGHANKLLDLLFKRRDLGLATPKQVKWLVKFGHPEPYVATFAEASEFLDRQFNRRSRYEVMTEEPK